MVQPVRKTLETIYPSPEFLSSVVAKKFIPLPQGARGYNCHSEGLAEESQSLVANASNFALTPPHGERIVPSPTGGATCEQRARAERRPVYCEQVKRRLGWGLTRREKTLPLLGGGRSCACIASYKCGEGVHPVREKYFLPNGRGVSAKLNAFATRHCDSSAKPSE